MPLLRRVAAHRGSGLHPERPSRDPAFLAQAVIVLDTDLQDGAGLGKCDLPDIPSAGFDRLLERETHLDTIDDDDEFERVAEIFDDELASLQKSVGVLKDVIKVLKI